MIKTISGCLTMVALAVFLAGSVQGQGQPQPPAYTVITVEEMHCDGCAKRIGGKLQVVPNVAKIQYDVDRKLFWVHPQQGKLLSPRTLWEAVEKGNDRPLKLQGPQGTFDKKPKS